MSKSLAASKQLMQTYLSELLTEEAAETKPVPVKEKQAQPIEQLLNQVSLPNVADEKPLAKSRTSVDKSSIAKSPQKPAVIPAKTNDSAEQSIGKITTHKSVGGIEAKTSKGYRQGAFQAMFFDVAGLTVAVPLIELGGIHNHDKTTALMGKPDWFKGVMLHRDEKVNVVDTARWVMPEKCNEQLISSLNYQYIIMLNDSSWGLTAERLVDTVTLQQEDVKWLDSPSKRPWLAGLVKDRMCALLDVDSLIKLLEKGVNITQE